MSIFVPLWTPMLQRKLRYLLRATFDAGDQGYADAQVLDTAAEGVQDGQLTVVEVDGTLAIVSNKCAFTAQGTPVWGDLGLYSQAIAKMLGRALLNTVDLANTSLRLYTGWASGANLTTANRTYDFLFYDSASLYMQTGGVGVAIVYEATEYHLAVVLGGYDSSGVAWRSGQAAASFLYGAAWYVKGGAFADWTLVWRDNVGNTATLYAVVSNYHQSGVFDDFRVPDKNLSAVLQPNNLSLFASAGELSDYTPELGGVWTEDIGDWDTAAGALQATVLGVTTFPGLADCIKDAKITTPAAGTIAGGLVLRGSDYTGASEDYWYVKITPDTAGTDWELIEYAAGAATQRASGDVDWAAATAYNIRATCDGQTISCFADGGDKISYALASHNETATDFGLRDEGNANMTFDNVALFARTSNVYEAQFGRV